MPAAGQHPPLHGGAAEQPPLDLHRVGGVDDPIALAVADQHRGPDRDQLVAHVGEQARELVDGTGRAPPVGPELLDALEPVEVHVTAGPVPAHHMLADGQQPGLPAGKPDRGGEAGHGDDLRVMVAARWSARLPPPDWPATATSSHSARSAARACSAERGPVLPDGPVELLRCGPVTGEQRPVTAPSGGCQRLSEAAQLGRRPGETVQQQHPSAAGADPPWSNHRRIEGIVGAGGHDAECSRDATVRLP